jgi:hypothetical protein
VPRSFPPGVFIGLPIDWQAYTGKGRFVLVGRQAPSDRSTGSNSVA